MGRAITIWELDADSLREPALIGPKREKGKWNGLIGLHAQVQVEKMYKAMGYETDVSMGKWYEDRIEHVGMFKRVKI